VTAVLANLRAQDPEPKSNPAIEEAIRMRRLASIVEMMQTGKAVSTVHRLASRWLVRHRARKAMEKAKAKANSIAESDEMGVKAKQRSIEKLCVAATYKQASLSAVVTFGAGTSRLKAR
jgi:hypothetical protein